ncbi:hypothetical protein SAMN05192588_2056 [Nonlabens sp. Hel1_33_55]|uniref:hypothetical protein n=1 Tax=Nonlabens sp. Hel1_33_55 TaxID=1336802 RepID=UPI000875DDE7|nr:hypothetical protein [Nonlabens sp. Hel1_33_55]SCY28684.1 hypothetical protein SAMN05192588_2056 [Nonlabens sp. Hel1_33_55]
MYKRLISILNLLIVIILIAWNGYANTGNFNGKTVGDLSAEYNNLFTPASYAFSIWGLIFLMLLVFAGYGVYAAFAKAKSLQPRSYRTNFVVSTFPYFLLANIFCSVWVALWLQEMIGASVMCMVGILACLLMCIKQLDMELWDAPFPVIAFVWWPLCLYSGWISVAIIANVASFLNGMFEIPENQQILATICLIVIATVINLLMIWYRNMREYAAVAVWALVAIYVRHTGTMDDIAYLALGAAIVLFLNTMVHGYQNRATNPMLKFKQWRASKA